MRRLPDNKPVYTLFLAALLTFAAAMDCSAWWNDNWAGRTKLSINAKAEGSEIAGDPGETVVLVRLHPAVLPFEQVQADGGDLRFVGSDDKTLLPFHLEKFDTLMGEGFAWVRVPQGSGEIYLYYGNAEPGGEGGSDPKKTYPDSAKLVYHFTEKGTAPQDSTAAAAHAETAGAAADGAIVGDGVRLIGREPIKVPPSPATEWKSGADMTAVVWVKPMNTAKEQLILSRNGFKLGLAAGGAPFIEVAGQRAEGSEALPANNWKHLAAVASADGTRLFVDGKPVAQTVGRLSEDSGPLFLGGPDPALSSEGRFAGEIDEFELLGKALSNDALRFLYVTQSGTDVASKVLVPGEPESSGGGGHSKLLEHLSLFGDIAHNMMFDGWMAIGLCVIMMIAGWSVAVVKFVRLGRMEKGNAAFQKHWHEVSSDLTALDLDKPKVAGALGKEMDEKAIELLKSSPLYHVYHVGSEEIQHRLGNGKNKGQGLSARSIQAIRAALDSALVHEQHRLNKGIVYLTISIAGGPYVGLLGTVVGVMITFAVIAKSGEVDVNSIAPGIASALLATTVGLLVAIPALFMYSFLSTRIKAVIGSVQVFIDEFVAKVAEFYPTPAEMGARVPIRAVRSPEEAVRIEEGNGSGDDAILAEMAVRGR